MKKAIKIILGIVVVLAVLVLALPLWIGPVGRLVAEWKVPGITGTDFHLGELGLNPYSGRLHVGKMDLANPEKFYKSQTNALELGSLDVEVNVPSVLTDKIQIREIVLDGLMFYYGRQDGYGNFDYIAANAQGMTPEEAEKAAEAEKDKEKDENDEEGGKKVQIDKLVLKNITVKLGPVPIKVPMTITIEGIGKEKEEGATWSDVWDAASKKVMSSCGAIGEGLTALGQGVADVGVKAAGEALGAATNAVGAVTGALKVDKAGEAASKAVGDAAEKAAGALKGVLGK